MPGVVLGCRSAGQGLARGQDLRRLVAGLRRARGCRSAAQSGASRAHPIGQGSHGQQARQGQSVACGGERPTTVSRFNDPVLDLRIAPGLGLGFVLCVGRHRPATVVERGVRHMRAQQILDELAYAAFAEGAVQAFLDDFVQGDGHSSAPTALLHTAFAIDANPTETPPPQNSATCGCATPPGAGA